MDYKELAKVFYMDSSSNREANLAAEEARRRDSVGTFRLGYEAQAGELFLAVPKELSALTEQVLRTERKVTALLNGMNLLAANAVLRGLVFDEVVFTNAIEGIHSTRRQIKDALSRYRTMLLGVVSRSSPFCIWISLPARRRADNAEGVRAIYDRVMDGEFDDAHVPDGRLFRKDGVDVIAGGVNVIHIGAWNLRRRSLRP